MRFAVPIPPGATYAPSEVSRGFSISPDGTRFAIEAFSKGRRRLFVRPLDSEDAAELEGSLDATAHFWSPDSRFIALFADIKLKKIPASGGRPQELCDATFAIVGTWSAEGTILFSGINPPGIYRVPDTGGEAVRVIAPDPARHETAVIWPQFLPDGRRFLFLATPTTGATGLRELRLGSIDSKEVQTLGRMNSRVEYAPPGFLLYVREGALFAQPFDERKARLHGEARQLVSNAHYFYGPAHAPFSASRTGAVAYQAASPSSRLIWLDREGREIGQLGDPAVVRGLRISPDGTRVALDVRDSRAGSFDIWVFEIGRGVSTRLHSGPVDEILPVWSPDASKLFYRSDHAGPPDIYEVSLGTPGSDRPVLALPGVQQPEDVSRDGRLLAYLNEVQSTVWNVWLLPLEGERKPAPWLPTRFSQTSPRFSPDGRWIAYESNETGDSEVYVAQTQGGTDKRRISPDGGKLPRWRADGRELYYVGSRGSVMVVPVAPGPQWTGGAAVPLFRVETDIENWDVAPDGSRLLVSVPPQRVRSSPLHAILNWPALLQGEK